LPVAINDNITATQYTPVDYSGTLPTVEEVHTLQPARANFNIGTPESNDDHHDRPPPPADQNSDSSSTMSWYGTPRSTTPPDFMLTAPRFPGTWLLVDTGFMAMSMRHGAGGREVPPDRGATFTNVLGEIWTHIRGAPPRSVTMPHNGTLYKAFIKGTAVGNLTVIMTSNKPHTKSRAYMALSSERPWRLILQGIPRDQEDDIMVRNMLSALDQLYGDDAF